MSSLVPVWLFFLGAFALLRLTRTTILEERGIEASQASLVLIGSIIVAKVVLIFDSFRFVERFRERPLFIGSLWKATIYFFGCLVFEYLDGLIRLLRAGRSLSEASQGSIHEFMTPKFWIIQLWLVILLLAFASVRELIRAMGRDRFLQVFFGKSRKSG